MFFYRLDQIGEICCSFVSMVIYKLSFHRFHPKIKIPFNYNEDKLIRFLWWGVDVSFVCFSACCLTILFAYMFHF